MVVVKWLSGRLAKERKIVSRGCFGQELRKENRQHRGSSKGTTVGKAAVQLQKQEITEGKPTDLIPT